MTRQPRTPAAPPTPSRWLELRPLDELVPAEVNPKNHDEAGMDASLEQFGYVEPIVQDERTGRLIVGHGRMESLARRRDRGDTPPEGIELGEDGRWLVPIARGWASATDDEARAYLVLANELPARGGWHRRPLAEFLADLDERAGALRQLAWSDEDSYRQLLTDEGVAGQREAGFLDDIDAAGTDGEGERRSATPRQGSDVVDLRLPMSDRERDEAVALLRRHQRALVDKGKPAATLSATALEVLRTWE